MRKQLVIDAVGLAGLASAIWGVRCIYEPAAFIVAGALAVAWAYLASRR